MSKLKLAKAVQKSFTVAGAILKWVGIVGLVVGIGIGLWSWANAHILSFAVIVGIVVAFLLLWGILEAWDWSVKTVKEAAEEERRAQNRNRIEKDRLENPDKYVPSFHDDYDDDTYVVYR